MKCLKLNVWVAIKVIVIRCECYVREIESTRNSLIMKTKLLILVLLSSDAYVE